MKKIIKPILTVVVLVIVLVVVSLIWGGKPESEFVTEETSDWPEYYQKIAEECQNKAGFECCMVGLREMVKNNHLLADKNGNCPEGSRANGLLCVDTLTWCEPEE